MRTDIFLRGSSYYKSTLNYFLYQTDFTECIWEGISVNQATLTKFFPFHFLLLFIISAIVIVHFLFLHETGSNNPKGILSE